MAAAPGPFSVAKTKKWIFDSVEAPTIHHSTACASTFSRMLANEHEEGWLQFANRTISDIQISIRKRAQSLSDYLFAPDTSIWSKQVIFCQTLTVPHLSSQKLLGPAQLSEPALPLARSVLTTLYASDNPTLCSSRHQSLTHSPKISTASGHLHQATLHTSPSSSSSTSETDPP
jgi:hypothetical protein